MRSPRHHAPHEHKQYAHGVRCSDPSFYAFSAPTKTLHFLCAIVNSSRVFNIRTQKLCAFRRHALEHRWQRWLRTCALSSSALFSLSASKSASPCQTSHNICSTVRTVQLPQFFSTSSHTLYTQYMLHTQYTISNVMYRVCTSQYIQRI